MLKSDMQVKFVDLTQQYQSIKSEVDPVIQKHLEQGNFVSGPSVEAFEKNFVKAHGAKYCVAVSSGTSALHLAMWALGIKEGDEVIVPTNTFIATASSVSLTGATPVFVDCETDFYTIDCKKLEKALTNKTKAILPVHLYGQPSDMDTLCSFAKKHNLLIIEDCAQAHLSTYKGKHVGTFGKAGCFSFYPSKNLGAYGEGGAVITNDEALYNKMRALREHGSLTRYYYDYIGQNYRMQAIQGAILDVKLKHLPKWNESRRQIANWYHEGLKDIPNIQLPKTREGCEHVFHLYVIRVKEREELMRYLEQNGISTNIHYPLPCHLQKSYSFLGHTKGDFPSAEILSNQILSLPIYPELEQEKVDYVIQKIRDFYKVKN